MNKIRVCIVGIGNMGSNHARSVFAGKIKGMELAAVCDIAPQRREWANEALPGVPTYEVYEEMLDAVKPDAVIIATPHYFHPGMAIAAFERGIHVVCEKPAGVYTKQVAEMNAAAEKAGVVFSMMYNQRTNPLYQKARSYMQNGVLGEPKRLVWIITDWYRTQAYYDSGSWRATWAGEGGGVLINQCPHNLDLWQWIFGMPIRLRADCQFGRWHDIEVEDEVTAFAEYANGATASFITTTGEAPGTNRLEITGDRGKLVIENDVLKLWELSASEREWCKTCEKGFDMPPIYTYSEIKLEGEIPAHNGILQNFTNAVLYGEELIAPGAEGIRGLTISNAIHLSGFTGDWVELPIDEDLYLDELNKRIKTSKAKENFASKISDLTGTY